MTFLNPAFLWGLIALAVPIIVHFFYLRRSRRYIFTQTQILEKLMQASRPYLRLSHLILLFLRLMIVGVIVFIFARPLWSSALPEKSGKVSALIIVDVSPSMRTQLQAGIAFLKQVLASEKDLEEAKVLPTDRLYGEGTFRSVRECLESLSEVQPADMGYPLGRILQNMELHFAGARAKHRRVYILSDFQSASIGDVRVLPTEVEYVLLPLPLDLKENAFIDSVTLRLVGGQRLLGWHLRGEEGRSYTIRSAGMPPLVVGPGWREVPWPSSQPFMELSIEGDAVSFDNRFVVGSLLGGGQSLQMSIVGRGAIPAAFERAGHLTGLSLRQNWNDSLPLSVWLDHLEESPEWAAWVEQGGVLVVFPPPGLSLTVWSRCFLSTKMSLQATVPFGQPTEGLRPFRHPLWEGVFQQPSAEGIVPAFFKARQLYQFYGQDAYPLLATDRGEVLLWETNWGEGRVYLFTFPWSEANFGDQSLFPVFVERLYAMMQRHGAEIGSFFLGRHTIFSVARGEGPVQLKHIGSGVVLVPPQRPSGRQVEVQVGDYPLPAGLYEIYAGQKQVGCVGANISPDESAGERMDLRRWNEAGLRTRVIAPEGSISGLAKGSGLRWRSWYVWVLLAVALLILETWWARRSLRLPLQTVAPLTRDNA